MKSVLIYLLLLFGFVNIANSQWMQVNGPFGGYCNSFCRAGNGTLLTSTGRGIYSSTDNGENWVLSNNLISDREISSLKRMPNNIIIAASSDGVLKSMNNGVEWINAGLQGSTVYNIDVKQDNTLFAIANSSLIYRSTNYGNNWVLTNTGATMSLFSLYVHPNGSVFAGDLTGVVRSTNNGTNWVKIQIPQAYYVKSICSNNSGYLFVATSRGIYRSTNNGDNWIRVNSGLTDTNNVLIYQAQGFDLFAGGANTGLYKSTNNGDNWSFINNGISDTIFGAMFADSAGYLFAGTHFYGTKGVYRSGDNGNTWTVKNNGITNSWVTGFAQNQDYIFTSLMYDGIYRSSDKGNTWEKKINGLNSKEVNTIAAGTTGILFSGFTSHDVTDGGVYRSTNNGDTWNLCGIQGNEVTKVFAKPTGEIFAVTLYSYTYRSTDNGLSWISLPMGGITCMAFKTNGQIVVGTNGSGIYTSYNNGSNWTSIGPGPLPFNAITVTANGTIYAGASYGVYKSVNNGNSWTIENSGLPATNISALATNSNDKIFTSCFGQLYPVVDNAGVFYSTNSGSNWIGYTTGISNIYLKQLFVDTDGYLFAGTQGSGIYRTINTTGISNITLNVPTKYKLLQNYPNPFNPTTNIKFDIPKNSFVSLKVFDVLGKEVAVLINEVRNAGSYSVDWNASVYTSGVYFYKLESNGFSETRRMLLVK